MCVQHMQKKSLEENNEGLNNLQTEWKKGKQENKKISSQSNGYKNIDILN